MRQRFESHRYLQWLSRRWLYNIPRSLETRGFRALGRLAMVDHARSLAAHLRSSLSALADSSANPSSDSDPTPPIAAPRVMVLAATGGGTGSGMVLDIACAVRSLLEELEISGAELWVYLVHMTGRRPQDQELARANSYALLTELRHMALHGNCSPGDRDPRTALFERESVPWNGAYFLHVGDDLGEDQFDQRADQVAAYFYANSLSTVGRYLDRCRDATEKDTCSPKDLALRSFGLAPVDTAGQELPARTSDDVVRHVIQNWQITAGGQNGRTGQLANIATSVQALSVALHQQGDESSREQADSTSHGQRCDDWKSRFDEKISEVFPRTRASGFEIAYLKSVDNRIAQLAGSIDEESINCELARLLDTAARAGEDFASLNQEDQTDGDSTSVAPHEPDEVPPAGQQSTGLSQRLTEQLPDLIDRIQQDVLVGYLALLHDASSTGMNADLQLGDRLRKAATQATCEAIRALEPERHFGPDGHLLLTPTEVESALRAAEVHVSGCGHARRLVVVAPYQEVDGPIPSAIRDAAGHAQAIPAPVEGHVLLHEAERLSLCQVASGLTQDRPDLIDAARLLRTRVDIDWDPLPGVRSREADESRTVV